MITNKQPLFTAGLVLGIGLGGFFDGILFHQILQIHNMLSNVLFPNTVANIEINMFWDGLFHAFTWIMTLIGLLLLWKAVKDDNVPKVGSFFIGSIIIGFGLFNLVEGTIDHLILQIHHVVQRTSLSGQFYSDIAFLFSGLLLIVFGIMLIKKSNIRAKK